MYMEVTEELKRTPNDWVLLDENKKEIDSDKNLCILMSRNRTIQQYTTTTRWTKPIDHGN